jgi:transcriptional regulator with XRE-family HTH domain
MMKARELGKTQEQAAAKAGIKSRKTVSRYERVGKLPSEMKVPRRWRTRQNPFAEDWAEVVGMLEQHPELEGQTLFAWLNEKRPGKYQAGQVRTFQRHIARWRAVHVEQVASLPQERRAGELLETDGTWLSELGVSIGGEGFKHILIHCVLPYSNWEWGYIAQSESVVAVREAIQRTIHKMGAAPVYHQTDNSTAATYQLRLKAGEERGEERVYHPLYLEMLNYYGMQPKRTHVRAPDENGDVESSNGGLKAALRQQLLLRGSRDFATVAAYQAFVEQVMEQRNRRRQPRFAEEVAAMKPVKKAPISSYRERKVRVSANSLIWIQTNCYSVPTSLIGHTVTVRQGEWEVEIYYQQQLIERLPRLVGRGEQQIQYRHLVESLLRKPGGFRNYRYRPALFPQPIFQRCWEALCAWYGERQGDLSYLRILRIAAQGMESEVALALTLLLESQQRFGEGEVQALLKGERQCSPPPQNPLLGAVNLQRYDRLLPTQRSLLPEGGVA